MKAGGVARPVELQSSIPDLFPLPAFLPRRLRAVFRSPAHRPAAGRLGDSHTGRTWLRLPLEAPAQSDAVLKQGLGYQIQTETLALPPRSALLQLDALGALQVDAATSIFG